MGLSFSHPETLNGSYYVTEYEPTQTTKYNNNNCNLKNNDIFFCRPRVP